MPLLDWKPAYRLGIPAIDFEHRKMIEMINDLHRKTELSASVEEIETGLGEILSAISAHFALEEREMRIRGYDEFTAHKEDHEALLDSLRDIMEDYTDDTIRGRAALRQRLAAWFTVHFASFDARLHRSLGSTS